MRRVFAAAALTKVTATGRMYHKKDLESALLSAGILYNDIPRIRKIMNYLPEFFNTKCFLQAIRDDALLCRTLSGRLVVPNFPEFKNQMQQSFEKVANMKPIGAKTSHISFFSSVDDNLSALGVCTVDGQRMAFGDADEPFPIQALARPILYCMVQETGKTASGLEHDGVGLAKCNQHCGIEPMPSDASDIELNPIGRPFNPLTMSGAIMLSSLIGGQQNAREKLFKLSEVMKRMQGGEPVKLSEQIFEQESDCSNKHKCVSFMMKESGVLNKRVDIDKVLDFYFMGNSVESSARSMSVLAGTLASGGVCPTSGEQIFSPDTVKNCLSMMYSCGADTQSGEFAFKCGFPAKGAVNGAILIVIPNVLGAVYYAPHLNLKQQPEKGIAFCQELVAKFSFHNIYTKIAGAGNTKSNPLLPNLHDNNQLVTKLLEAASSGDMMSIKNLHASGVDLNSSDYDNRTAAHLASAEGELQVLEYFAMNGVDLEATDRWGGKPIDDATKGEHHKVVDKLKFWLSGTAAL